MTRPLRSLLGALAAAALAAALPAHAAKIGSYHVFPMPDQRVALAGLAQAAGGPELYYGGSVFSNVKVVSVMWSTSVSSTIKNAIPGFSAALVNSTYVDQMSQYDTFLTGVNGQPGTNQHIARGTYLGQKVITPQNTATKLTDAQVQAELQYQISIGALPPADLNTLYMIYFPRKITITLDGSRSCVSFGAYHEAVYSQINAANVFYSVEPDCGLGLSNITVAASHEFAEAMTDNIPTPGSSPAYPQAWNNSTGYEVGDLCSTNGKLTAGTKSWTVTQFWSNTKNACSTGNYTSP
jgi:hypothetical protein